jgi:hypothetical protein
LQPKGLCAQEEQRPLLKFFRQFSTSTLMRSNVSLRDATSEFSPKRKDVQPPCPDAMSEGTYPTGADLAKIGRRWKGKFSAGDNA